MTQQGRERRDRMEEQQRGERPIQTSAYSDGRGNAAVQSPATRRPGLVTFAAVMMFALGGFHVLLAISEFANSTWVLSRLDIELFIQSLIIWGIFDLVIGLIALFAGASILRGGAFGWITGYAFAALGVIKWL